MLFVFLGFILVTSIAFGIPFLMSGDDRAIAAKRGIGLASTSAFVYVIIVAIWRSL
ncbi:MAG: hypothetical protein AAF217_11795 [Pseudomonadota bacterium]